MKVIAVVVLAVALTACGRSSTVEVTTGPGSNEQPYVHCDVGVPNPNYQPPATTRQ